MMSFEIVSGSRSQRGRENKILQKNSKQSFPFFRYHKINLHLGIYQSLNSFFSLCFLKYESFSNCEQSYYRNIGYFEGIYTCENLSFHLQPEEDVKFVSEMVCLHKCINSSKIAIIIYRFIKKNQLV